MRPTRSSACGEQGGAALLSVMGGMAAWLVALAMIAAAADYGLAAARAATAADAAALAAMAESPLVEGWGDPRAAAAHLAAANGARLDEIDLTGWPLSVAVEVSARPSLGLVRIAAPTVPARAAAAARPRRR